MYQEANRWIRKPTPVTTPSMVTDRPSTYRVKFGAKPSTDIHCHSSWLYAPPSGGATLNCQIT
ncbi:hypothetical protein D9M71_849740 [compost metagenome]